MLVLNFPFIHISWIVTLPQRLIQKLTHTEIILPDNSSILALKNNFLFNIKGRLFHVIARKSSIPFTNLSVFKDSPQSCDCFWRACGGHVQSMGPKDAPRSSQLHLWVTEQVISLKSHFKMTLGLSGYSAASRSCSSSSEIVTTS